MFKTQLFIKALLLSFVYTAHSQTDTGLDPDKLLFSKNNGFDFAEFSIKGLAIRSQFDFFRYDITSPSGSNISVGGDLKWGELGSNGLVLNQCCISKAEMTTEYLTMLPELLPHR